MSLRSWRKRNEPETVARYHELNLIGLTYLGLAPQALRLRVLRTLRASAPSKSDQK